MVNARKPHFLEVFLPALCSHRLKVPTKFIKHLEGRTSGSILLTGPSDNSWHVDLIVHNGHLFFDSGWPTFVKDHSMQCGDSLVFRYDGNLHFTVHIFDQTSCEKEEAFEAKCSQEQSYLSGCLGKKRERAREGAISNVFVEKKSRGVLIPVDVDFLGGDSDQKIESCCNEDQEVQESPTNGYDYQMLALIQASENPIVVGLPALSSDDRMLIIGNSHREKYASKSKTACSKKKRSEIVTQTQSSMSKFVEERAAHYFTSGFPYFVRVMTHANITRGRLRVPMKFSKEHFPNHRTKVVLQNLDGECWVLNCIPTSKLQSTVHIFCGGWLSFARSNGIKREDVCIFELVDKFEMRVHILRLSLEGLESQTQRDTSDAYGVRAGGSPLNIAENVLEDNVVHHLKISEHTDDLNINDNMEHKEDPEATPGTQEGEYLVDTCNDASALKSPDNSTPFLLSGLPYQSTDHLLAYDANGTVSHQTSIKSGAELCATRNMNMPLTTEDGAAHSFTSAFPSFMKVMTPSNVSGSQTLPVPNQFSG